MARKGKVESNKHKRRLIDKYQAKRRDLKAKAYSQRLSEEVRQEALFELQALPRNSSPVRYRNRCRLTGRSRGYLRKFGMSRILFRELASQGRIPGVRKASW